MTVTAIVGCRHFYNEERFMLELADEFGPSHLLITGDAPGTDFMVYNIFSDTQRVIVFRADWDKHGKAAGPIRNAEIVRYADRMIAFWDGQSPGTYDAIQQAQKKGIPLKVIRIDDEVV